jgi:hypothetical protein
MSNPVDVGLICESFFINKKYLKSVLKHIMFVLPKVFLSQKIPKKQRKKQQGGFKANLIF